MKRFVWSIPRIGRQGLALPSMIAIAAGRDEIFLKRAARSRSSTAATAGAESVRRRIYSMRAHIVFRKGRCAALRNQKMAQSAKLSRKCRRNLSLFVRKYVGK